MSVARIGVLALQGGVREHGDILSSMGTEVVPVRTPEDLERLDALVLPGGESTTLITLMDRWGLTEPVRRLGLEGLPMLGTCAGAVLLSSAVDEIEHEVEQRSLGLTDVAVVRNWFGRQCRSFTSLLDVSGLEEPFPGVFIRAPILRPGPAPEVLAVNSDGPVMTREGSIWLAAFHPELTGDDRVHRLFLGSHGILGGSD